ncbi:serine protease [Methylobacterium sp. A54F]
MACRGRIGCLAGLLLAAAGPGHAQQPAQRPPAAAPDPAVEAMRTAFEALPEADRRALQDALIWVRTFKGTVTGAFGRQTYEALTAAASRMGTADPLAPPARAAILAAAESGRRALRFSVRADPASGARIGVPEALVPKRSPVPGGTRWQSENGRITLETRSYPPEGPGLDALFERATAPFADRKVTYKLRRPDFIVVRGETGAGRSYVRYDAGPAGVRGFALSYERGAEEQVEPVVIAIANSFVPFPAASAEPGRPVAATPAPPPPVAVPDPAPAGTGLRVAPGRVLTAAGPLQGCAAPRAGGAPARILKADPARGLALLEAAGAASATPAPRPEPVGAGTELVVVAADRSGIAAAPGTGSPAGGVFAPLQPGAAGAPVLDRAGRLAGLVARFPAAPRLVAGVVPPTSQPLTPASAVAAFLAENGIAPAGPAGAVASASLGAVTAPLAGAVVAITCGR